ncbi:MAG: hypothetical protein ABEI86_07260, partial [Halobacteriaceae archaeon]
GEKNSINSNLQLEYHTQFDEDKVTVNGRTFEDFLRNSHEFEFISWVLKELPYEIQDTAYEKRLEDLYRSIPDIRRVDLYGGVAVKSDEEDHQVQYDVIFQNKTGEPLIVANVHSSHDPVTNT